MNCNAKAAIVILGEVSAETASRIKSALGHAEVLGLRNRVTTADTYFSDFGTTLRTLYESGRPIIALCATGIIIRALAKLLEDKRVEPPVLAVAEDGSAVVPLLGGLSGVNDLAIKIAATLDVAPAITTTGALRFGINLLHPPQDYTLANPDAAKRFTSNLLSGEKTQLIGKANWLTAAKLPRDDAGKLAIRITPKRTTPHDNELIYHPRSVVVAINAPAYNLSATIEAALAQAELATSSVALLLAHERHCAAAGIHQAAAHFKRPLRFVDHMDDAKSLLGQAIETCLETHVSELAPGLSIGVAAMPEDVMLAGRSRGKLHVVGLGPGDRSLMAPAVADALEQADDVLGYETYVRMAGPFRADQTLHATDNREEMQRARHAFELAASGRSVVMVSSGDPGVFAMATAIIEALHEADNPAWHGVELTILPGISAALAAAARSGAPMGHDFCILSLSDNLKPWSIIEKRLDLAGQADLVMAFYNPISKARPHQLGQALDIVRRHRSPETPVVLGRDIGRPAETTTTITLGELTPELVDMRTVVIIGSSTTRSFSRIDGGQWTYTPRWY